MNVNRLLAKPVHIFLVPLFFIWHVLNQNFVLIPIELSAKYLLYYLILATCIFLTGKFIFRNNIKAGCWTTSMLIVFFFWGSSHDFLRSLSLPVFFSSYKFLISLCFAFFIWLAIYLRRRPPPFKLHRFFTLMFSLFVVMEAGLTAYKLITDGYRKIDPAYSNPSLSLKPSKTNVKDKPDIFFIVFDEYASTKALKKFLDYDNSSLDSSLLKNGFYIANDAKSNYNSTALSITSVLNMQYFNAELEGVHANKWLMKGSYSFKHSYLPQFLEKEGYRIFNFSYYDLNKHPASDDLIYRNQQIQLLSLETVWGRIKEEIFWNFMTLMPGYKRTWPASRVNVARNYKNYSRFKQELQKDDSLPRFVISHVLLPHDPFYLDRQGNYRIQSQDDKIYRDSLYIDQVIYTNRLIDSLSNAVSRPRKRPLVLIIEGDHGFRVSTNGPGSREKQLRNLNSYYFSDRDYSHLYDSMSPVNSFRAVLNKYFDTRLPMLKDSSIIIIDL